MPRQYPPSKEAAASANAVGRRMDVSLLLDGEDVAVDERRAVERRADRNARPLIARFRTRDGMVNQFYRCVLCVNLIQLMVAVAW